MSISGIPREFLDCRLLTAMAGRRSRRVARGVSIDAGPLSYTSPNAPAPLDPLEEAILIVATGFTGAVMHDGPLYVPGGGRELGTPFLHSMGRAASSPDNQQSVRFIMVNDEGTWLLKRIEAAEAMALMRELPPKWDEWTPDNWLTVANATKHRIGPRLSFPRRFPYYLGWNKQLSNVPGTTMFLPIVDCTRGYINAMLNLAMEPDGQRPLFVDDWQHFSPESLGGLAVEVVAALSGKKLPYAIPGGTHRIVNKYVNPEIAAPLGLFRTFIADHEAHFHTQNLMLLTQAMGLGGWVHFCPPSPYLFEGDRTPEVPGLGFTMATPTKHWGALRSPPPPPSWMPNPVGIPGVLEALTPPFVANMDEAVDRVLEEKFGADGSYRPDHLVRGLRDMQTAETYAREATRYDDRAIAYVKDVCNHIWDTYGRFPAHVDAWYVPGTWLQVAHPELEYYERMAPSSFIERQRAHAEQWGDEPSDAR